MPVPVFTHPSCIAHDPGADHPETPARLTAVLDRARKEPNLQVREARLAGRDSLLAVHPAPYLSSLEAMSARGGGVLFLDTMLNEHSWSAALGASGAVLAAVDHAISGRGHAFAAIRPPGHHALASRGMGFCLVNHVVIAARYAQRAGHQQVLIVDWDVHHGNGTQALVETDPSVRYVSLHQHPWYPGTGAASERGVGNIFNVPRGPGQKPELYVDDLWAAIHAASTRWKPDLVLLSAGFDAMNGDPLGGFTLEPIHYTELTQRIREHLPQTPIAGLLEGGYVPARVAEGVIAHLRGLQ
ncbi:MAG TPA: histone deacetylase [Gemmatimonadales bacterium]|jgi:acetoin utilization deacetylase AcuC-like enzyme|nr:histone deacetylase [Gemmatimonadales bacterium]